jgi:LmbE family N-acetylglucosaminyl deacetylase
MSDRTLVVSPHLDDAVLSCGAALSAMRGAAVVTIFAGAKPNPSAPTAWDRRSGFVAGDDVTGVRRAEDARALGSLGSSWQWLEFTDADYRSAELDVTAIADAIAGIIRTTTPSRVLIPVGVGHPDHILTFEAATLAAAQFPAVTTVVYADAPYSIQDPAALSARIVALRQLVLDPRPLDVPRGSLWAKHRALVAYRSQRRALGWPTVVRCTLTPERFWAITPVDQRP